MDNEEIIKKIQEYDEAFDFYMNSGQMPEYISEDDLLGDFVEQAIHDNPQIVSQDPLWIEILKEEILKFIEAMINLFEPIEVRYKKEKMMILAFAEGDIDQKRKMWNEVYITIKSTYSQLEVNIDIYVVQMKSQDLDSIFASLIRDWNKACDALMRRRKEEIIERSRSMWEQHVKDRGVADFKQRKNVERLFYSYPQLADIVKIIGREQPHREEEMDETVRTFIPLLPSPPKPAVEIEEINIGRDLRHLLPIETSILSDHQTEDLFYIRYANSQLQHFANKPQMESVIKTERKQTKKPRFEKGPIIVCLDTSGSMMGKPEKIARSILMQLLRMAKKQKRKCYLITFSVRARHLDLSRPNAWYQLNSFLKETFTGGTDGEEMLNEALKMLYSENFSMADVLIISDFLFPKPISSTREKMNKEHNNGTRFYGLQIESKTKDYDNELDKIWKI